MGDTEFEPVPPVCVTLSYKSCESLIIWSQIGFKHYAACRYAVLEASETSSGRLAQW